MIDDSFIRSFLNPSNVGIIAVIDNSRYVLYSGPMFFFVRAYIQSRKICWISLHSGWVRGMEWDVDVDVDVTVT